jgi:hypothetical protein
MMRVFAWLPLLIPYGLDALETDVANTQADIITLLATTEMHTLVTTNPALTRTLRQLCRMFGIEPPHLIQSPKPEPKPKPAPKPKPPRAPRDRGPSLVGFRDFPTEIPQKSA